MTLLLAIPMVAMFVVAVHYFWARLDKSKESFTWFAAWAIRGIAIPTAIWMFFNLGIFQRLPSLVPDLDVAPKSDWFAMYLSVSAIGMMVIALFWTVLSMGIVLVRIGIAQFQPAGTRKEPTAERREFFVVVALWAVVGCLVEGLLLWNGRWGMGLFFAVGWPFLLAYSTVSMAEPVTETPMYSRAIARMQVGKYEDAESEVLRELEKKESDYQGWLMLAELYANHFHDLPAADRTIHELCQDPNITVPQIAEAMNKLADWYLNSAQDPPSARRILEELCRRLPGTHLARMAQLRINQLPRTREALNQPARSIPLPHVDLNLEVPAPSTPAQTPEEATAKANALLQKLQTNPHDIKAREELARIYAEELDKLDLALTQMETLLAKPEIPPRQGAEWLNRMSMWLVRFRKDEPGAQALLERLIHKYPESTEAFTAQRRLSFMRQEVKVRRLRTYLSET